MVKIYDSDGTLIGLDDRAVWVKTAENGCKIECDAEEAEGIAFKGDFYEGAGAVEVPAGLSVNEIREAVALDEDATVDLADMVASHEDAITELAELIAGKE